MLKFRCLKGVCTDGCLSRTSVWSRIQQGLTGKVSHMRMVFRQTSGKHRSLRCSSNPNSGHVKFTHSSSVVCGRSREYCEMESKYSLRASSVMTPGQGKCLSTSLTSEQCQAQHLEPTQHCVLYGQVLSSSRARVNKERTLQLQHPLKQTWSVVTSPVALEALPFPIQFLVLTFIHFQAFNVQRP